MTMVTIGTSHELSRRNVSMYGTIRRAKVRNLRYLWPGTQGEGEGCFWVAVRIGKRRLAWLVRWCKTVSMLARNFEWGTIYIGTRGKKDLRTQGGSGNSVKIGKDNT